MDYEYFKAIPWCSRILEDSDVVLFTPPCRLKPDQNGYCPTQDQLVRKTLFNDDGIPHVVAFHSRIGSESQAASAPSAGLRFLINSSTLLLHLRPGLNGYNGGAHGGLIGTLIDEAMGTLIFQNHEVYKAWEEEGKAIPPNVLNMHGLALFTARMTVRYEKPIATPGIVLVTASLDKIEGRKVQLKVVVRDEKDAVLARGDGLWISVPQTSVPAMNKL